MRARRENSDEKFHNSRLFWPEKIADNDGFVEEQSVKSFVEFHKYLPFNVVKQLARFSATSFSAFNRPQKAFLKFSFKVD